MRDWFHILIGTKPLPENVSERAAFLQFADAHHVLGQLADQVIHTSSGKTRDVLDNALYRSAFDSQMLAFEVNRLERALLGQGIAPILLKGAAYVAAGLKAGRGRRVSDIDILVSDQELDRTESLLRATGWDTDSSTANEYDQAYYRDNMHELPPLRHKKRRTIMDVHHRLLPPTARIKVGTALFMEDAVKLEGHNLRVFNSIDMFIHSAIHTFADGSYDTPMRSMLELWLLLADIPGDQDAALVHRANKVGASKPVYLAFHILSELTDDERVKKLLKSMGMHGQFFTRKALTAKFNDPEKAYIAKAYLYIRSHYLRMPLAKLVGHLAVKAFRRTKRKQGPVQLQG